MTNTSPKATAAVIGLGSMGLGMALSLLREGIAVVGCDVVAASVEKLVAAGGKAATTPAEAARGADVVISVVVNAAHIHKHAPGRILRDNLFLDRIDRRIGAKDHARNEDIRIAAVL